MKITVNDMIHWGILFLLPMILSGVFYLIDKKTPFKNLGEKIKQVIFGLVFGALAIYCTVNGPQINGTVISVRDAVIVTAALLFGSRAGMICAVMAFYYRMVINFEYYTQFASAITAILVGINCVGLRRYMFDNKKPFWLYPLGAGMVSEVLLMLLIFITKMSDVQVAFECVKNQALSMILCNGFAALMPIILITYLSGERLFVRGKRHKISSVFQRWLLFFVGIAIILTMGFNIMLQNNISDRQTKNLLSLNIQDVQADIKESLDENILTTTRKVAAQLEKAEDYTDELIKDLAEQYDVEKINIVGTDGIIQYSTDEDLVGFDITSNNKSAEFLCLLDGRKSEFVQDYQSSYNNTQPGKLAGVKLADGRFIQAGYDTEHFYDDLNTVIIRVTRNRHVGKNGSLVIADKNLNPINVKPDYEGKIIETNAIPKDIELGKIFVATVYGESCYCMCENSEGYFILAVLPVEEADFAKNFSIYVILLMEILIFVGLFVRIYFMIKSVVVDNIREINDTLSIITSGNLNVSVNVRDSDEFASLSDDINSTVETLKKYINEAASRIDKELEFARTIQKSVMPTVFLTSRVDVELYADMNAAKEVGGDFYDFYFVDNENLVFLIADVSGKGIPGAMFMMQTKALIKGYAESGVDVDTIMINVNDKLCEGNDAEMFVTAWIAKLNLVTGKLTYVNAGHNPPLIKRDDHFEYLRTKPNFVLAGFEGIPYKKQEFQLQYNDSIYLYTDGITEATNSQNELYGEQRLKEVLNPVCAYSPQEVCAAVNADVASFVKGAAQFDDITMLCLTYKGGNHHERNDN